MIQNQKLHLYCIVLVAVLLPSKGSTQYVITWAWTHSRASLVIMMVPHATVGTLPTALNSWRLLFLKGDWVQHTLGTLSIGQQGAGNISLAWEGLMLRHEVNMRVKFALQLGYCAGRLVCVTVLACQTMTRETGSVAGQ